MLALFLKTICVSRRADVLMVSQWVKAGYVSVLTANQSPCVNWLFAEQGINPD